ncbi:thioredoxin-like protein [Lyophyllum atratum]|nr:thioredoxin-like protein [Lyophyllum atratum]
MYTSNLRSVPRIARCDKDRELMIHVVDWTDGYVNSTMLHHTRQHCQCKDLEAAFSWSMDENLRELTTRMSMMVRRRTSGSAGRLLPEVVIIHPNCSVRLNANDEIMSMSSALRSLQRASIRSTKRVTTTGIRTLHSTAHRAKEYPDANLETFNKVVNTSGRIVLVDFYADWCAPCHQLSPILSKFATEASAKSGSGRPIDLVKINTEDDELIPLAQKYKVRALPTVIAFRDGELVDQFVGALPEPRVQDFLSKL